MSSANTDLSPKEKDWSFRDHASTLWSSALMRLTACQGVHITHEIVPGSNNTSIPYMLILVVVRRQLEGFSVRRETAYPSVSSTSTNWPSPLELRCCSSESTPSVAYPEVLVFGLQPFVGMDSHGSRRVA